MSALYVETSAVLSWLLGEPSGGSVPQCVNAHDQVASSVLTAVETARALRRAEDRGLLSAADRSRLQGLFTRTAAGWHWLEVTGTVRERASRSFPREPVRTLDALHLASALELLDPFPELEVLSFDERILQNLHLLGLSAE